MANTYVKIASYTASTAVATIDFSSIPATYTDLVLKVSARSSASTSATNMYLQFNASGGTAYSYRRLYGTGSTTTSNSQTALANFGGAILMNGSGTTASTFSNAEIYIPNYAGGTAKSISVDVVEENNATAAFMFLSAGLWSGTSAINQITLTGDTNFVQYSTATLYGILKS